MSVLSDTPLAALADHRCAAFRRGNKAKREASKAAKTASTAAATTTTTGVPDEEPVAGPIAGTSGAKPSSVLSESTLGKRPHAELGQEAGEGAEDGDDQETVDDDDAGRYLGRAGVEEVDVAEEEDDEAMDVDEGAAGEEEDDVEDVGLQEDEPAAAAP